MIAELVFDDKAKEIFAKVHEETANHTCSGKDCGGCAMYNVCNFEEPPIAIDNERVATVVNLENLILSADQQKVVDFEEGISRVNAGAGAGKTLSVALRTATLLEKGYEPEDICLLTFTRAGAEEMATRVSSYCAMKGILIDPERLIATTFNSFCQNIINDNFEVLGYTDKPRVIPRHVKLKMLNNIIDKFQKIPQWNYSEFSDDSKHPNALAALTRIEAIFETIKKERYTIDNNPFTTIGEEYRGPYGTTKNLPYSEESVAMIFQMYDDFQKTLKEENLIEYDDQIREVERLVRDINPDYIANNLGFKHIIIDEFQDTDLPQIELLQDLMQHENFKSYMAVGDDDQSIFSFRHTTPEYMINFQNYFGVLNPAYDFKLIENHRSDKAIIDYANKINTLNVDRLDKDLIATRPLGNEPEVHGFYSAKQEYSYIAKQVKKDIENGKDPSDIAILGSTWGELKAIAAALTEEGIPSVLGREIKSENSRIAALCSFYEAFKHGSAKGLMDYQNARMHGAMKGMTTNNINVLIEDMREELSNKRRTLSVFKEYAKVLDESGNDACYQAFLEEMEYARSMDELDEFFNDFKVYGKNDFFMRKEIDGKSYAGVQVTTVHAAKGLEWDTTYLTLTKFDRSEFHKPNITPKQQTEYNETNRKWFVGATRAKTKLVMTGQYVLGEDQRTNKVYINAFLEKAFELKGKVFDYNQNDYNRTKILERQELASRAQSAFDALNTSRTRTGNGNMAVTRLTGRGRRNRYSNMTPNLNVNNQNWVRTGEHDGNIHVRIMDDDSDLSENTPNSEESIRPRNRRNRIRIGSNTTQSTVENISQENPVPSENPIPPQPVQSIDDWMNGQLNSVSNETPLDERQ